MEPLKVFAQAIDASTQLVELHGEIDLYTAPEFRTSLGPYIENGPETLVISLEHVAYVDSSGLSVLLEVHRRLTARNASLLIVCTHPQTMKVFTITGLIRVLRVHASLDEALQAAAAQS